MDDSFVYPALVNILMHNGPKWLMRMEYKGELSGRDWTTGEQYPGPGLYWLCVEIYDILQDIIEFYFVNGTLPVVAGHDDEKFYYFNYRSRYPHLSPKETQADYQVSKRLIKYLVNFAYFGWDLHKLFTLYILEYTDRYPPTRFFLILHVNFTEIQRLLLPGSTGPNSLTGRCWELQTTEILRPTQTLTANSKVFWTLGAIIWVGNNAPSIVQYLLSWHLLMTKLNFFNEKYTGSSDQMTDVLKVNLRTSPRI